MATFIKSEVTPSAPLASNPYVEKDFAIVRGVTLAMFDLSHPDCYPSQASAVKGGDIFANLVSGGESAALQPTGNAAVTIPYVTGTLRTTGTTLANFNPNIRLPAAAFLPTAATRRMLVTCYLAINQNGNAANGNPGIVGAGTGNGTGAAYQAYLVTDANGKATELRFRVNSGAANLDTILTGAALAAALDGNVRQFGFAFQIVAGVGQGFIYVDGAPVVSGPTGAMTQFNQPGGTSAFPGSPGVGGFIQSLPNAKFGRVSFSDLTPRPDLSFAALLARDAEAASGYLA